MIARRILGGCAVALLSLGGCGNDQTLDPGSTPQGKGGTIQVAYQMQTVAVDPSKLSTVDYRGINLVKLSVVWAASAINADHNGLAFEFVSGTDGFKPSNKGCPDLAGTVLDKGYIDPSTRKLTWDESLGFKGCYSVNAVAQMNAHAPTGLDAAAGPDAGDGASDAATD